jgi:DnaA family protein
MAGARQILLPLEARRPDRLEDFVAGKNAAVLEALRELVENDEQCLFLSGPAGSGKTHLLNAVCNLASSQGQQVFYIAPGRLPVEAAAGLAGLDQVDLVCVDDIDLCAGQRAWEEALFHCFNRLRGQGGSLVASSSTRLSALEFSLPDLASRLGWGLRLQLQPLDEQGKTEVMHRWAQAHAINLPEEVQSYLLRRGARSLPVLMEHLEAVRVAALAGKRQITVPLAREVLQSRSNSSGSD